jgi:hypothetical protein
MITAMDNKNLKYKEIKNKSIKEIIENINTI